MIRNKLLLVFLFTGQYLFAQQVLQGSLLDAEDDEPIIGALIKLTEEGSDGVDAAVTDGSGRFVLSAKENASYLLQINTVEYVDTTITVQVENVSVDLGNIRLPVDVQQLKELVVEGQANRVQLNGDTTEINAKAYKVNESADAEKLLEKMPGIVIENGTVQAQGEDVQQVLVDGKPFFDGDPNAVLKNLPADVIDKIQIYDKESDEAELSGFSTGNTSKTINITLKSEYKNSSFGKAYGGGGPEDKYRVGGSYNKFKGDSRITVIGQSNNINIQNFSTDDLLGVVAQQQQGRGGGPGGGRGGSGGRSRGGGGRGGGVSSSLDDFRVGQQGGISTVHAFGVNYQNTWDDKLELASSYFFNATNNRNTIYTNQYYFSPAQTYGDVASSSAWNINHKLSAKLQYRLSESDRLIFRPNLTFQQNDGASGLAGGLSQNGEQISETENDQSSALNAFSGEGSLTYRHSFDKRGRSIVANMSYTKSTNEGDLEQYYYIDDADTTYTIDQIANLESTSNAFSAGLSFSEPISDNYGVQVEYDFGIEPATSDKRRFNYAQAAEGYTDLDTALSSVFDTRYQTHSPGVSLRRMVRGNMLIARFNYQRAELKNESIFPYESSLQKSFDAVLPGLIWRRNFNRQQRVSVSYRTTTQKPSLTQLQEVIDNSNPLLLTSGNSNLDQQYDHNVRLSYHLNQDSLGRFLFAGAMMNLSTSYIGSRNSIVGDAVLTTPENMDGYFSGSTFISYGSVVKWLRSNLNSNLNLRYVRTPAISEDLLYYSHNKQMSVSFVLGSNISEKVDFTFKSQSSFNLTENDLNNSIQRYFTQVFSWRGYYEYRRVVVEINTDHQFYAGYSDQFDNHLTLLNGSVGRRIFKDGSGVIKLYGYDLLNQNTSFSQTAAANYILETNSLALRRYIMLSFTYDFKHFKS